MEPAVTTMLDRAIDSSRPYIVGRGWRYAVFVASSRAGSPLLGCKRSPQQAESLTAGSDRFPRNPRTCWKVAKVISS